MHVGYEINLWIYAQLRLNEKIATLVNMDGLERRIYIYIQGVPGGKDLTSGECSLGQTILI
jgi:hypothetical protein